MATVIAWKFSTLQGVGEALAKLEKLSRVFLVSLHDAVALNWEVGRKKPKTVILPVWRFCEGAREHAPGR